MDLGISLVETRNNAIDTLGGRSQRVETLTGEGGHAHAVHRTSRSLGERLCSNKLTF